MAAMIIQSHIHTNDTEVRELYHTGSIFYVEVEENDLREEGSCTWSIGGNSEMAVESVSIYHTTS